MLAVPPTVSSAPALRFRPYQETCIEQVLAVYRTHPKGGRAFVVLPTGCGKTIVFAEIARRLRLTTMIVAHRQELLQQAADKFRLIDPTAIIGQVGAGRHEWGAPVTVASVQTISRPEHLKALKRFGYQLIIVDECFPAGTLIDGTPIEHIKAGDLVTAFNEHTKTFARKCVIRTFRHPVGARLVKISAGPATAMCTPNHPFYTSSGWKPAAHLMPGEEVLYAQPDSDLYHLPSNLSAAHPLAAAPSQEREAGVLLGRVPTPYGLAALLDHDGQNQSEVCERAHEAQQSYAQGSFQAEDAANLEGDGPPTQDPGWQREGTYPPSTAVSRSAGTGLADGVRGQNTPAQVQRPACSNELQARSGPPCPDDRHRGRRDVSRAPKSTSAGSQIRPGAHWVRVDGVEIYEPGSDGTFAGLCPEGEVYNFEVEDDHTYLANGFVVHNCHHTASDGYQAVLDALPDAFVLGVTATPDRMDKQSIEGIFGEPVFTTSIIDMVEQGYLCDLRAIAVHTGTNLDSVHTQAGDFKQDELEEAIDTPERNARVVTAYQKHAKGRQALCFAVTVAHAQHLADAFNEQGVKAAMVSGETPAEERKRLLHDFERGVIAVMCNVGVLTEGYDVPQISCVIMARPTKSRALYVQSIGRGTRLAPGKRDCIILDITDNCLKHRIEPLKLGGALGQAMLDGESLIECKKREETEAPSTGEREACERVTKVTQRAQDLAVDVLTRMNWRRLQTGTYILEIGAGDARHKILLVPSEEKEGHYTVWARLAPDYRAQQWAKASPLSWATTHAEMKARLLQAHAKKRVLVDDHAPWRARPATHSQVVTLGRFHIPLTEGMTSGEASDLIGHAIAERDRQKAEKAAKTGTKQSARQRARGRASA